MIALIGFAISWYVTYEVTFLSYAEPNAISLAIEAAQPLIPTLSIRNEPNNGAAVDIDVTGSMPQSIEFYTPQLKSTTCIQHWHPVTLGQENYPQPDHVITGRPVAQKPAPLAIDIEAGGMAVSTVTCELSTYVFNKTYVQRQLSIVNASSIPIVIDVSRLTGAENLSIVALGYDVGGSVSAYDATLPNGRRLASDQARVMAPGSGKLLISWDDAAYIERRDLLLIVIGAIVGIASVALLEWIRPYISD